MQLEYKIKKRYPYNKENNEYYCEVRTHVPGAHIKIIVRSWLDSNSLSMNGTATLKAQDFVELSRAIDEAKNRISEAQLGSNG